MRGSDGIWATELSICFKNNSLTHNHHKKSLVFVLSKLWALESSIKIRMENKDGKMREFKYEKKLLLYFELQVQKV